VKGQIPGAATKADLPCTHMTCQWTCLSWRPGAATDSTNAKLSVFV